MLYDSTLLKSQQEKNARPVRHSRLNTLTSNLKAAACPLLFLILNTLPHVVALTESVSILRQLITDSPPSAVELTNELADVSSVRPEQQDWSEGVLVSGSPWRAFFSASQE